MQHDDHGKHNKHLGLPADVFAHGPSNYGQAVHQGGSGPMQGPPTGGGPEGPVMGGGGMMEENHEEC
jgi:hypothetical protein